MVPLFPFVTLILSFMVIIATMTRTAAHLPSCNMLLVVGSMAKTIRLKTAGNENNWGMNVLILMLKIWQTDVTTANSGYRTAVQETTMHLKRLAEN